MFLYIQMLWLGGQRSQLKQQYHNSENESDSKCIPVHYFGSKLKRNFDFSVTCHTSTLDL